MAIRGSEPDVRVALRALANAAYQLGRCPKDPGLKRAADDAFEQAIRMARRWRDCDVSERIDADIDARFRAIDSVFADCAGDPNSPNYGIWLGALRNIAEELGIRWPPVELRADRPAAASRSSSGLPSVRET